MDIKAQESIIYKTNKIIDEIEEIWNRPDKQQNAFMIYKAISQLHGETQIH